MRREKLNIDKILCSEFRMKLNCFLRDFVFGRGVIIVCFYVYKS